VFFVTYLRRELLGRPRQAAVIAAGLALGIGLVVVVSALSSGVREAQGKVLGSLYGVGTDITVTTAVKPAAGSGGFNQITPKPYPRHTDILSSSTLGRLNASAVSSISTLRNVSAAVGGLVLTEITTTIPADNAAPPPSFQPPVQTSVVGMDPDHTGYGPFSSARLASGRGFTAADATANVTVLDSSYASAHRLTVGSMITVAGARLRVIGLVQQNGGSNPPQVYLPLARAQQLAKLTGKVNIVYVQAASAALVGAVTNEISKLMPSAKVTNSANLAKGVAGSLATTAKLANNLGKWLAVLTLVIAFTVASLLTLAAVTRRAREFGTLKALGWRSRRITGQLLGECLALGIAGAVLGIAAGFGGTRLVSTAAPELSATVQQTNIGKDAFGGDLGANGGVFSGQVGGPVTTYANPSATHTVAVPFHAPITLTAIVLAIALAIIGGLIAGSLGSWRITRLRPAAALASVE
jgi:putative ABC transport system permease protein